MNTPSYVILDGKKTANAAIVPASPLEYLEVFLRHQDDGGKIILELPGEALPLFFDFICSVSFGDLPLEPSCAPV